MGSATNPEWVAKRQAALAADKKPQPRSRQLAMFPRPERLTPEMARPDQFHRLPGVMWHGNYHPSEVTKPSLGFFHNTGSYEPVGVHAGTRRAAMDVLDWHGQYDSLKDPNYVFHNAESWEERVKADTAHGAHGYLHPVLPPSNRMRRGKPFRDVGDDWTDPVAVVNYRDMGKKIDAYSMTEDDPWGERRPSFRPEQVKRGLRYLNDNEHPGSVSALIPTSAPMQHSDYVRDAILNGRKVHPLTERLYNDGVLDAVEAKKYLPMSRSEGFGTSSLSNTKRDARTARVRASRKREFLQTGQEELPFG